MMYFVSNGGDDGHIGSFHSPWKTLELAVSKLEPGDTLYIRGGEYILSEAVVISKRGDESLPIVLSGYGDEEAVINAINVNFYQGRDKYAFKHETGAIFVLNSSHIKIRKLKVVNSHGHGIAVRDSDNVTVDGCTTENTFACGISLWDTKSTASICHHNKIVCNTVIKATTWNMLPDGMKRGNEPPHEAISVAGACHFEVCFNHVHHCDKEGIDVKENARFGSVHHNHVHHVDRQGLYADAWFGPLSSVDFYENNVHDCKGAGIVVSVEQGEYVSDIKIHSNTVCDNWGSGILFGIFGADRPRMRIDVYGNRVEGNGIGTPTEGFEYFWITGGICMLSANITDCTIHDNILSENRGFDIGYSDRYIPEGEKIEDVFKQKKISMYHNLILDHKNAENVSYPIRTNYENSVLYGLDGEFV